jgi:hypothetical protein
VLAPVRGFNRAPPSTIAHEHPLIVDEVLTGSGSVRLAGPEAALPYRTTAPG